MMQNLGAVSHTVCVHVAAVHSARLPLTGPKILGTLGPGPFGVGRGWPLEKRSCAIYATYQIW